MTNVINTPGIITFYTINYIFDYNLSEDDIKWTISSIFGAISVLYFIYYRQEFVEFRQPLSQNTLILGEEY